MVPDNCGYFAVSVLGMAPGLPRSVLESAPVIVPSDLIAIEPLAEERSL